MSPTKNKTKALYHVAQKIVVLSNMSNLRQNTTNQDLVSMLMCHFFSTQKERDGFRLVSS